MTQAFSAEQMRDLFVHVGEEVIRSKPLLTEIDSATGDGDHGIGMEVGFTNALEQLKSRELACVNDVFKTIGMAMINTMGGASGVIFGTMFIGGVKGAEPLDKLDLPAFADIMEKALQAVKDRGKADLGDKTMIDALQPATIALKGGAERAAGWADALAQAEESARRGVEDTKAFEARFGRAKSLGARAVGHQDAGATTVWIIFRSMREWVEKHGA